MLSLFFTFITYQKDRYIACYLYVLFLYWKWVMDMKSVLIKDTTREERKLDNRNQVKI